MRCLLFVPGDSERKLLRSADSPADALILDLEDSVAPERKAAARALVRERLDAPRGAQALWVRINALDTPEHLADLAAVVGGRPAGVMLPKAAGDADVRRLDAYLSALEAREGVEPGAIRVLVVATETGAAMFGLGSYTPATPRLAGLTWGAEDLSTAVGASSNSDEAGAYTPLYVLARSLCLAAAAAAETTAVDGVHTALGDDEGLARACRAARRDGFTAKLAIHPGQAPVILENFTPTAAELDHARAVVVAFEGATGVARL
ncbi:MAG: CoA ester lyase, partial [Caulobacteraceae bacterium]|nr:CoA ester lyase [Caulobacter sp.]